MKAYRGTFSTKGTHGFSGKSNTLLRSRRQKSMFHIRSRCISVHFHRVNVDRNTPVMEFVVRSVHREYFSLDGKRNEGNGYSVRDERDLRWVQNTFR